jgi:hypothetical protein
LANGADGVNVACDDDVFKLAGITLLPASFNWKVVVVTLMH